VGVHVNKTGQYNMVWAIHDIRNVQILLLCFFDGKYIDDITFYNLIRLAHGKQKTDPSYFLFYNKIIYKDINI
jgi:hypothetical protein